MEESLMSGLSGSVWQASRVGDVRYPGYAPTRDRLSRLAPATRARYWQRPCEVENSRIPIRPNPLACRSNCALLGPPIPLGPPGAAPHDFSRAFPRNFPRFWFWALQAVELASFCPHRASTTHDPIARSPNTCPGTYIV